MLYEFPFFNFSNWNTYRCCLNTCKWKPLQSLVARLERCVFVFLVMMFYPKKKKLSCPPYRIGNSSSRYWVTGTMLMILHWFLLASMRIIPLLDTFIFFTLFLWLVSIEQFVYWVYVPCHDGTCIIVSCTGI
jgi:hypothetical protein